MNDKMVHMQQLQKKKKPMFYFCFSSDKIRVASLCVTDSGPHRRPTNTVRNSPPISTEKSFLFSTPTLSSISPVERRRGGAEASERAGAMNGGGSRRGGASCADESGSDQDGGSGGGLRKPLLNTGSWYRMGSRSSLAASSMAAIRESHVSAFLCTLIVALGPIQFGFTSGFSSPTQDAIIRDLKLSISEVPCPFQLRSCVLLLLPLAYCVSFSVKFYLSDAVLGFRFAVQRRRHGRSDRQWADGGVHWPERGENLCFIWSLSVLPLEGHPVSRRRTIDTLIVDKVNTSLLYDFR